MTYKHGKRMQRNLYKSIMMKKKSENERFYLSMVCVW